MIFFSVFSCATVGKLQINRIFFITGTCVMMGQPETIKEDAHDKADQSEQAYHALTYWHRKLSRPGSGKATLVPVTFGDSIGQKPDHPGGPVMFFPAHPVRVYIATGITDMRKSINGLSILVADQLELDPLSGHLFAFCNRKRDIIKIMYWDRNGFCLWHKRLERDRFRWPLLA